MATQKIKLRPIDLSPTTAQYFTPKHRSPHLRPPYIKKFYPSPEIKNTLAQPWLAATDPTMPPYPYGRNTTFEEANHGLYGGLMIQSGNKISKGRNKGKTLRKWYPNVRVEKLRSQSLNVELTLPVTARVSRTIMKVGGLDEYLLGEKPARLKELGLLGWKLRWLVLKSKAIREKHAKERAALRLPEVSSSRAVDATFAQAWEDPDVRRSLMERMSVGWQMLKTKDDKFQRHVRSTLRWKDGDEEFKVREMRTLNVYDPVQMVGVLPESVEEDVKALPEVQEGFGFLEIKDEGGKFTGIESVSAEASALAKAAVEASTIEGEIAEAKVADEEESVVVEDADAEEADAQEAKGYLER